MLSKNKKLNSFKEHEFFFRLACCDKFQYTKNGWINKLSNGEALWILKIFIDNMVGYSVLESCGTTQKNNREFKLYKLNINEWQMFIYNQPHLMLFLIILSKTENPLSLKTSPAEYMPLKQRREQEERYLYFKNKG